MAGNTQQNITEPRLWFPALQHQADPIQRGLSINI